MIVVNRIGENIIVSYADKEFDVLFNQDKFDTLIKLSEESLKVSSKAELDSLLEQVEEICKDNFKEKVEAFHEDIFVNNITKEFFLKVKGVVTNVAMPDALVRRIQESMDKSISIDPLMKFWTRALRSHKSKDQDFMRRLAEYIDIKYVRPDRVKELMDVDGLNEELAKEKATTYEVQITQEGLISCFKTSNEHLVKYEENEDGDVVQVPRYKTKKQFDPNTGEITGEESEKDTTPLTDRLFVPYMMGMGGDAFYCEGPHGFKEPGHFIKVGCTHRLPDWSYVNCDDNVSCVKGLHLGGLSYIASWGADDIHRCFVDPMHVGAIPDYAGDKAIRVLQYFVYDSLVGINDSIYHSSTYAEQTDKQWDEIKEEILKAHTEKKEAIDNESSEITNL